MILKVFKHFALVFTDIVKSDYIKHYEGGSTFYGQYNGNRQEPPAVVSQTQPLHQSGVHPRSTEPCSGIDVSRGSNSVEAESHALAWTNLKGQRRICSPH